MSPSDGLATSAQEDEWLWGWDPTPGIVSIWADSNGSAIVWRRIGATGELIREEARFRPWLLLDRLDDLHFLGSGLAIDGVADDRVTYRELDGPGSLRFLVSASDGRALAKLVLQGAGRRPGRQVASLRELGQEGVLALPPEEQYLVATGRTYFRRSRLRPDPSAPVRSRHHRPRTRSEPDLHGLSPVSRWPDRGARGPRARRRRRAPPWAGRP